jgi:uncharacterized membrane protein
VIPLAQITADELATADTAKLLAIIVLALVAVVIALATLLLKLNREHKDDIKAERETYRQIWKETHGE